MQLSRGEAPSVPFSCAACQPTRPLRCSDRPGQRPEMPDDFVR